MRKHAAFFLIVVFLLALISGCSGAGKDSSSADMAYDGGTYNESSMVSVPNSTLDEEYGEYDEPAAALDATAELSSSTAGANYGGRKIIRRFEYNITSPNFDEDLAKLKQNAVDVGGYVQNSSVNGTKPETYNDNGRSAHLSFAIPSDKVDAFVAGVEQVGTVTYRNTSAEDVSDQYIDLESRIEVLRTQLERLKSLLVDSASLEEILALETEISRVTIELEQLTTNLKALASLVDYSTVNVYLDEERIAQGPSSTKSMGTRISEGFVSVLNGVGVFLENFAVFLLISSPVWLMLGLVALVVILLVRRHNRKKGRKTNGNIPNNPTDGSGNPS